MSAHHIEGYDLATAMRLYQLRFLGISMGPHLFRLSMFLVAMVFDVSWPIELLLIKLRHALNNDHLPLVTG
jgi:hypothetical protein